MVHTVDHSISLRRKGNFPHKDYEMLLTHTREFPYIDSSAGGDRLNECWSRAQSAAAYFTSLYSDSTLDDGDGKFFALADYLVYIPYADNGYKLFEAIARESGAASVAEYRYSLFKRVLGAEFSAFGDMQTCRLMQFFTNFERDDVDMTDIASSISFICRMCHRLDAQNASEAQTPPAIYGKIAVATINEAAQLKRFSASKLLSRFPLPDMTQTDQNFLYRFSKRYQTTSSDSALATEQ